MNLSSPILNPNPNSQIHSLSLYIYLKEKKKKGRKKTAMDSMEEGVEEKKGWGNMRSVSVRKKVSMKWSVIP